MARPLLLGHRGARASRHIPENTLASFDLCLQHGCDGFEFDVRRSSDGEAVVCHDPTTGGKSIETTPASSLALPRLKEVLRLFSARAFLDIELKVAGLEQQTIVPLRDHPPRRGYVVSSFLPEVLTAIQKLDRSIPVGFLCENQAQLRHWSESPAEWVIPHVELVGRKLIDQAHSAGKKVMVWTVNRAEQMRQMADWGVDAIISDETELLAARHIS
jgi:glycerophosphoryl diester phosphodiesterase